jgi:hypothetical protein
MVHAVQNRGFDAVRQLKMADVAADPRFDPVRQLKMAGVAADPRF